MVKNDLERVKKFLIKNKVDLDKVDVDSHYDNTITYGENLAKFCELLSISTNTLKDNVERDNFLMEEELKNLEEQERAKGNNNINEFIKGSVDFKSKYFRVIQHYIKMIKDKVANGLILVSRGGLGKTKMTLRVLGEDNEDYVYISGRVSYPVLYEKLYEHNGKVIVLDDCDDVLLQPQALSILKSAINDSVRTITYAVKGAKMNCPKTFNFNGQLIILSNFMPNNPSVEALKSRCIYKEIILSQEELCALITEVSNPNYKDTSLEQRKGVLDYLLIKVRDKGVYNLNLRTYFRLLDVFIYAKGDLELFDTLAIDLLEPKGVNKIVWELNQERFSESERVGMFSDQTGKSRSSYFRIKKELGLDRWAK